MPPTRRSLSLWMATALLLANTLAACRASGVPTGAHSISAPATTSRPSATPAALPTAPAPTSALPGADAPGAGWRQLGQLVPSSANGPTVATLAIDVVTPTTLYAGTLYTIDNQIGLYRSADRGGHWSQASDQEYLAITPGSGGDLYAIAHSSLTRSGDSGASWRPVAAVRCGVQTLAPMPSGGIVVGCLYGRIYALE